MDEANECSLSSFAEVVSERAREAPLSEKELLDRLRDCDAVLSLNGYGASEITPDVLRRAGTVRVVCIAHYWGYGHFTGITPDMGITVVEGSEAGTVAVTEWIVTAALMGTRQLHTFDRALKSGSPWGEPRRRVGMLAESVAGIVGLGRTGIHAARYLRALGVRIIANSASCTPERARALGIDLVSLPELMKKSDIISLHRRVTDETRGMLGPKELSWIKPGCIFINAARAELYDEVALVRELRTGRFTAYIDVFAEEPLPVDHPFRSMGNVCITPHIAGNNREMFRRCGRDAVRTLEDYFRQGAAGLTIHRPR